MARCRGSRSAIAVAIGLALALTSCSSDNPEPIRVESSTTDPSTEASSTGLTTAAPATTADPPDPTIESEDGPADGAPPPLRGHFVPVVVAEYPHDTAAWTQGLEWYDGQLLESTGLEGGSSLRLVDVVTGEATTFIRLPDDLYAEGATMVDQQAIQITFKNETVLVTDLSDPANPGQPQRRPDAYEGQGWGLCYSGEALIMSNGGSSLQIRDPTTFEILRSVSVTLDGQAIDQLNELECVGEQIFANVWQTNTIVVIDLGTGAIEASIDATGLVPPNLDDDGAVLNGIAYNPETETFWLTGKFWPVLYEVSFELEPS